MKANNLSPLLLGVALLLVPLGLALVLPAPSSDTRELLSWGLHPSWTTPKQPPLMQWMGALVMRFAWPTTFWCVALTQALNALGLGYLYATLRLWAEREAAATFTLLFAGAIYFLGAPVAFALNADILQFPFWAAMLFHALRAFETNRIGHWLALALAFALAFYAKYTVALFIIALANAMLATPEYRRAWRNPRLYLSAGAGLLLVAPHLIAAGRGGAISHATGTLFPASGLAWRVGNVGEIAVGFLAYLAPAYVWPMVGAWRGELTIGASPAAPARFVRVAIATSILLLLILTLGLGFKYPSRYDSPYFFLAWAAMTSFLDFAPERAERSQLWMRAAAALFGAVLLAGGWLIYGVFTHHPRQQEPLMEAARRLQAEWSSRYSCGPAYVMGDFWSAYGLGISMQPPRPGVHLIEMNGLPGYDPALQEREGAILVYRDRINEAEAHSVLPDLDVSKPEYLTLPFARTLDGKAKFTVAYVFVPPKVC